MIAWLILALVVALLAVVFAVQNTEPVSVTFGPWMFEGSLALVLLLTLGIGVIIALLFMLPALTKRSLAASSQRKKIAALEKSNSDLVSENAQLQAQLKPPVAATPEITDQNPSQPESSPSSPPAV